MTAPPPGNDHLRALFEALPTGVLLANDAAIYVDVNRAACELLGRSREQLLGQHVSALVAPGRQLEVDAQWRAFLRDGSQVGVFVVELPGGRRQHVDFAARAHLLPGLHASFLSPASTPVPNAAAGEPLLTVCAWTKKIRSRGRWVTLEQYLADEHGLAITHGICPEAEAKLWNDHRRHSSQ